MWLALRCVYLALVFVPEEFRSDYRNELHYVLQERLEEARRVSIATFLRIAIKECIDLVIAGIQERAGMLSGDISYGLRVLSKTPLFTALIIATFALGIGANVAAFSLADSVLFQPMPYSDAARLVYLWETVNAGGNVCDQCPVSEPNFEDWQRQSGALQSSAAFAPTILTLTSLGTPKDIDAAQVTTSFFAVLAIKPEIGRLFSKKDGGKTTADVAIISHSFWLKDFGGDADVIGRQLVLSGKPYTIKGVLPASFVQPDPFSFGHSQPTVWIALKRNSVPRGSHFLMSIARLKTTSTLSFAQSDLDRISAQLATEHPGADRGRGVRVVGMTDQLFGSVRPALYILIGSVLGVLLIACLNVSSMMLSRQSYREGEFAIRMAFGADRFRIIKQLLTESFIVSSIGGAVGIVVAYFCIASIKALHTNIPRVDTVAIDARALLFAIAATVFVAIASAILPALVATRKPFSQALKESTERGGGTSRRTLGLVFVTLQIGLATSLVISCALLWKSVVSLNSVPLGFSLENRYVANIDQLDADHYSSPALIFAYVAHTMDRLKTIPGVQNVAMSTNVPLTGYGDITIQFAIPGRTQQSASAAPVAEFNSITPGYFQTIGERILRGRDFSSNDNASSDPVAIINQSFAKAFFPNEDPLGRQVSFGLSAETFTPRTIVGIVADARTSGLVGAPQPEMFSSIYQLPWTGLNLVMHSDLHANSLTSELKDSWSGIDPLQAAPRVITLSSFHAAFTQRTTTSASMIGMLAIVALVLSGSGIFGVLSFVVARSTRDIGIRLALGATPIQATRAIVQRATVAVAIGLALGVVLSAVFARALASQLFETSPFDAYAYAAVFFAILLVTVAAAWIPIRRALLIEPMVALRYE